MSIEDLMNLHASIGGKTNSIPSTLTPPTPGGDLPAEELRKRLLNKVFPAVQTKQTPDESFAEFKRKALFTKSLQEKADKATSKIPAAQLGYHTMATAAVEDYKNLEDSLKANKLTHDDIRLAFGKTPTNQTAIINSILYNGTDAWLRIQTGAQANPSEIAREMSKFQPKPWDSNEVIDYKLKSLFQDRLGRYKGALESNSGVKPEVPSAKTTVPKEVSADDILKKYGIGK